MGPDGTTLIKDIQHQKNTHWVQKFEHKYDWITPNATPKGNYLFALIMPSDNFEIKGEK